jgi:hypothetical protein
MVEEKKYKFVKAGMFTTICVLFVSLVVIFANTPEQTMIKKEMWQKVYVWTPLGAEGNPGAGASGFLQIFFINHSTAANASSATNDSNILMGRCDANMLGKNTSATADDFNIELESEKSFDIIVRVRFNRTHAYETNKFIGSDCNCKITMTCTAWADGNNEANVSAKTNGAQVESSNNSVFDFIYINFVWNAADNGGYQIADDATITLSEIYIEAKF